MEKGKGINADSNLKWLQMKFKHENISKKSFYTAAFPRRVPLPACHRGTRGSSWVITFNLGLINAKCATRQKRQYFDQGFI